MYLKIVIFLVYCLQLAVSEKYDKVNLTYSYEARCPYCCDFWHRQLCPVFKNLSNHINLEVIPVVRRINDDGEVICSHGQNECFITRAHACVFGRPGITGVEIVEFLGCTERKVMQRKLVTEADIEFCVNSVLGEAVSFESVQTCMNGEEVVCWLREYKKKQLAYRAFRFPWIALFGEFNGKEYHSLRRNFLPLICGMLNSPPSICFN